MNNIENLSSSIYQRLLYLKYQNKNTEINKEEIDSLIKLYCIYKEKDFEEYYSFYMNSFDYWNNHRMIISIEERQNEEESFLHLEVFLVNKENEIQKGVTIGKDYDIGFDCVELLNSLIDDYYFRYGVKEIVETNFKIPKVDDKFIITKSKKCFFEK